MNISVIQRALSEGYVFTKQEEGGEVDKRIGEEQKHLRQLFEIKKVGPSNVNISPKEVKESEDWGDVSGSGFDGMYGLRGFRAKFEP